MKTIKLLLGFALTATLFTSCYVDLADNDYDYVDNSSTISLNQLLGSYELWYIDINQTLGYGETPFLQMAFTLNK